MKDVWSGLKSRGGGGIYLRIHPMAAHRQCRAHPKNAECGEQPAGARGRGALLRAHRVVYRRRQVAQHLL